MRGVLPLTSLAVRILNLRSPPESSPFFLQAIMVFYTTGEFDVSDYVTDSLHVPTQ
jgi:hypothetical protein